MTYDLARRSPYQSAIPAMRHAPERTGSPSPTPIYDALYAEYRRTFRTLPGDRSGEEEFGFKAFATFSGVTGFVTGLHGVVPYQPGAQPGAMTGGGFHGPKRELRQLPGPSGAGSGQTAPAPRSAPSPPAAPPAMRHTPAQTERTGGYQTGTWRYGSRPYGPEDLLPAVLPTRRHGNG
ncbi:hypothetical protein [Streptomyces odontomachi]|uniref:hypothetical protein n=1 Tax=Streptomyces odontomachi TaxID=2944940 RepID=UPI00210C864D|nr:hypothetical protein [Streptomyces sp. ODS25]